MRTCSHILNGNTGAPARMMAKQGFENSNGVSAGGPVVGDVGILALVPDSWSSRWMVRHHIMARLGRYFHMAWVNPPVPWREALRSKPQTSADGQAAAYP